MLLVRTSIHAAHVGEIAGNATGAKILVPPERIPQSVTWKEGAPSPCESPRPLSAPSLSRPHTVCFLGPVSPPSSSFLVQLACPSSVKPSLTHTPSHRVCRPMPAPALAWSCLRSGPGLIRPRTPALSGTQGMFTNRVLDSCLLGLRLDPNHEGRSSEPTRSGRTQWLSSCSPSLKKS